MLPITKDALEEAYYGGDEPAEYIGSAEPDYDSLPDVIFFVKEYQYGDWNPANITDVYNIWYLNPFEFDNYLSDGIKIKFTGTKDYTINDVQADPSKFEYAVERMNIEKRLSSVNNDNSFIDVFNGNENGTIESNLYTISKEYSSEFIIYEKTSQPADTLAHQYVYDDTVYHYYISWFDGNIPMSVEYKTSIDDLEPGLYYGIVTFGNISDPIKAEPDEDGVYIIPDNDFVNREYIQGTGISLKGRNDYKIDGKESDASAFEYRLTGWPGTEGYVDLECSVDGMIQFPDPVFLGYEDTLNTTVTVFQTTKQPDDTETTRYSYDPSVYQFKIAFVSKSDAASYGIDESSIDGIDNEYILIYKD